MKRYLLDTTPLSAYLKGRAAATALIAPWIQAREVQTSILVYGEVTEYHRSLSDAVRRQDEFQRVLIQIEPLGLDKPIMERYADLRRHLRLPHGPGLIGDMDTLIAATALEHGLTMVTADSDFLRVPDLDVMVVPRKM